MNMYREKEFSHIVSTIGADMYQMAKDLFPICRSISGDGVRETLAYIQNHLPGLKIHSIATGEKVFDWTIPNEWNIRAAYIENQDKKRVVDFQNNNLHIMGYSEPVDLWMDLPELRNYLHSIPSQPNAIPYVTSYYKKRWGFCLTHNQKEALTEGNYHVVIDSDLNPGNLNYADLVLPGESDKEIIFSTYVCHPSMANNELSGPIVTTMLAKLMSIREKRRYTYRFIFVPETIGAVAYLSKHLSHLKRNVIAGFNVTCIGDDRCYSYLPSRDGNSLSDRAALQSLKQIDPNFNRYSWLDRGSDERQYCAPGVDLPIASIMRSKYLEYPEYHTSLDDLTLISPEGLAGGYNALKMAVELIEENRVYKSKILCEPQLSSRGLYPTLSKDNSSRVIKNTMDFLSYCDGNHDVLDILRILDIDSTTIFPIIHQLLEHSIIEQRTNI